MSTLDPLGYNIGLPLRSCWYPVGFPLELATNSADIERCAREAWGDFAQMSATRPATLRIHVTQSASGTLPSPGNGTLPQAAMPRGQGHLISIVFGPDHYAMCDVSRAYAFISLTEDAARNHEWTRYHFLEPLGWLLIDALHTAPVHASAIACNSRAAILCGDSGSGKTTLAYACARRGWTFLSGDAVHLIRDQSGFEIRGRPAQIRFRESAREIFPELATYPALVRPNGKADIEVSPCRLGVPAAYCAEAGQLVFLNRSIEPVAPRLTRCSRTEALDRLTALIPFGDPDVQAAQRETIEHFLALPLHDLHYSDTASAQIALRGLMCR
jgi:shikimate kinase